MAKTVIGLFDTPGDAQDAFQALHDAGFSRESLSVMAHEETGRPVGTERTETGSNAPAVGATAGAVLGGLGGLALGMGLFAIPGLGPLIAAGPIATTLAGVVAGGVTGGILGALVNLGVPHEEAEAYAEGVRRGGTLLALSTGTDDLAEQAATIMRRHGAVDIKERAAEWRRTGWTRYDPNAPYMPARTTAQSAPAAAMAREREMAAVAHQAVAERESPTASYTPTAAPSAAAPTASRQILPFEQYEDDFRKDFDITLANRGYTFEHHLPAYRYGYMLATDERYAGQNWDAIEPHARAYWEERNPSTWDQFRTAIRYAWQRVTGRV